MPGKVGVNKSIALLRAKQVKLLKIAHKALSEHTEINGKIAELKKQLK